MSTTDRNALPHACIEGDWVDTRTCYELRTYGYSPVLRDESDHSEGMYMTVDRDGDCECDCHEREDDDFDY